MSRFLKIIHRPRWEQFHVGTIFLLAEGSVHVLIDERLDNVTDQPGRTPIVFKLIHNNVYCELNLISGCWSVVWT